MVKVNSMGLFRRRKETDSEHDTRVEVVVNHKKVLDAAEQARKANQHFAEVLEKNGITVKIFLAAGGKHPKRKRA